MQQIESASSRSDLHVKARVYRHRHSASDLWPRPTADHCRRAITPNSRPDRGYKRESIMKRGFLIIGSLLCGLGVATAQDSARKTGQQLIRESVPIDRAQKQDVVS